MQHSATPSCSHLLQLPCTPQLPAHRLDRLVIDADGLLLVQLSASQLFGAAAAVQLLRAGNLLLLLPLPDMSKQWSQLLKRLPGGVDFGLRSWLCCFALLAAFRSSAGLQTAQLCARQWLLQLPLLPAPQLAPGSVGGGIQLPTVQRGASGMRWAVKQAFHEALGLFGRLRTTPSKIVDGELRLSLQRSWAGAAAIRTAECLDECLVAALHLIGHDALPSFYAQLLTEAWMFSAFFTRSLDPYFTLRELMMRRT